MAIRNWFKRHGGWALVLTACATLIVTLVGLNFAEPEKQVEYAPKRLYGTSDPQFRRVLGTLLGPPIVGGNKVETLENGDEIFPSMLAAIRSAEHTIDFETYVYWSGQIGRDFADAIAERARAGVTAHVLLDWVGAQRMEKDVLKTMTDAGARVEFYHPLRWYTIARMNNRTHRKLLVVDGRIGFTGGVGIADKWTGDAQDPDHWRDTHFRVEGPVVAQMQGVFMDNWIKTSGAVLHGAEYFPGLATVQGGGPAQVFSSSPTGGSASMELMYLMAITAAKRTIRLSSSYFVPNDLAVNTMVQAMKRGVKLQIIVPGAHTDTETVRGASKARWGKLLEAGAEIYEYEPTMYHCKVMIVDEFMVSTGSTNFDDRSFRLNDEANLNIYDRAFAAEQVKVFDADLAKSRRMDLATWRARPLREKLVEHLASLLGSQL